MSSLQVFVTISMCILMSTMVFGQEPVATPPSVAIAGLPEGSDVRILPLEKNKSADLIKKGNRVKLVLVGDGFKADEKDKFFEAANRMYKYLFSLPGDPDKKIANGTTPFNYYYDFFVVAAVFVPSKESGSCMKGTDPVCPKDTAFRTFFNCNGIDRLTCLDPQGDAAARALFAKVAPDWHIANVIINDPRYGGSGGNPSTTSLDGSAHEVVAHELIGHNFARLGDEYDEPPYPGFPDGEEFNTTKEGDPKKVKWADIVEYSSKKKGRGARPVSDPVAGARYDKQKYFRPTKQCKMRELGQEFCRVCIRGIIHAIHERINSIESFAPVKKSVKLSKSAEESFRIGLIDPEHKYFSVKWTVVAKDGTETPLSEGKFDVKTRKYTNLEVTLKDLETKGVSGKSKLRVTVSDLMPLATMPGTAVDKKLQDVQEWDIEVKK